MGTNKSYRNLVLTGFMGTGKTTIGRIVARKLDMKFIDVDIEIAQEMQMSIPAIFAQYGEVYFRQLEYTVGERINGSSNQVISTGGGMLIDSITRGMMSENNLVICLQATVDVIEQRLTGETGRPLAKDWRELLQQRQPVYNAFSYQFDTSDSLPAQTAEEIVKLWQQQFQ